MYAQISLEYRKRDKIISKSIFISSLIWLESGGCNRFPKFSFHFRCKDFLLFFFFTEYLNKRKSQIKFADADLVVCSLTRFFWFEDFVQCARVQLTIFYTGQNNEMILFVSNFITNCFIANLLENLMKIIFK